MVELLGRAPPAAGLKSNIPRKFPFIFPGIKNLKTKKPKKKPKKQLSTGSMSKQMTSMRLLQSIFKSRNPQEEI